MPEPKESFIRKLADLESLPALPAVFTQLEAAFTSEDSDAADIADVISEDPALASQVLKVANSVLYGIGDRDIVSIRDAVIRVGFAETRNLCTTLCLVNMTNDIGDGLDHEQFWMHSLVVAVTTRVLADFSVEIANLNGEEAYTAGLLHDIGVLVLDHYFQDIYQKIRKLSEQEGVPSDDVERLALKLDHGEIGGLLLDGWNMPKRNR